ncbi:uncharacterized protein BDV17DRAFT_253837 [Aspergillus undulatus]|uniref:uncharacterized protein n=1 Tax=Aspergillus undulatus TaxID=1810928 RepID=UPI003CCE3CF5
MFAAPCHFMSTCRYGTDWRRAECRMVGPGLLRRWKLRNGFRCFAMVAQLNFVFACLVLRIGTGGILILRRLTGRQCECEWMPMAMLELMNAGFWVFSWGGARVYSSYAGLFAT